MKIVLYKIKIKLTPEKSTLLKETNFLSRNHHFRDIIRCVLAFFWIESTAMISIFQPES